MEQETEIQEPRAMTMLKEALVKLDGQMLDGDFKVIADKSKGISTRTVIRYVREGKVGNFAKGKEILDIGNKLVSDRERSLSAV